MATTTTGSRRQPPIRKGGSKSLPFKVAIAGWIDLLGYGKMIAEVDYNPIAPAAKNPINRLRAFHRIVAEHSGRNFRSLVLNDGAVVYRDLSLRTSESTIDFFMRAWELYAAVQASEDRSGHAGARMVISPGLRAKGSRRAIDYTSGHLDSILKRMGAGTLTAEQAVREAAAIEKHFDVLPQLQANFAFSRAYIAEQSGTRFNLPGPACYVDELIFDGEKPDWIDADPPVAWEMPKYRLSARFCPVRAVRQPQRTASDVTGFRDGIAIAERVATSEQVQAAIRAIPSP